MITQRMHLRGTPDDIVGFAVSTMTPAERDELITLCQMARVKLRASVLIHGVQLRVMDEHSRAVDTIHDEGVLRSLEDFRRAVGEAVQVLRSVPR